MRSSCEVVDAWTIPSRVVRGAAPERLRVGRKGRHERRSHPSGVTPRVPAPGGESSMRRPRRLVSTVAAPLLLAVVALGACSGNASVSPPTSRASTRLAGAALPSIGSPSVALSAGSPSSAPGPSASRETATVTATQTETQTKTQTQTQTATRTATVTNTVTNTVTQSATQTPTQTPTPTATQTAVLAPAAAPSTPPSEGRTWWPWLLLGLALLGVLLWLLGRRRQEEAVLRAWDERLAAADGEASWVEDSLTDQVLSRPTAAEAQTIWLAAQPRLLQADKDFHDLAAAAPDGPRASRATDVGRLLRSLVEAVGADLAAPSSAGPDGFRARRAAVDSARHGLREALDQVSGSADGNGAGAAPSGAGG